MAKINYIQTRKDAQWGFQLNDGRIIEVKDKEGKFLFKYDTPINLETGEIGPEPPYTPSAKGREPLPEGFTTLNGLKKEGKGDTVYCFDYCDIDLGYPRTMTIRRALRLAREFRCQGFDVSSVAIMHNFEAWHHGLKSGYRDEKRGTHLFTPCGGNPFSLRATTLEDCCKDWQTTYTC